jgi:hypothetical protein
MPIDGEGLKPLLEKVIDARNESNPLICNRLIEEAFASGARFTNREGEEFVGREAIAELVSKEVLDPEHWVRLKGRISPAGDRYVFRWSVSSSISAPQNELCWLTLDDDGKIDTLTVRHAVDAPVPVGRQVFEWSREHPAPALAAAAGVLYAVLRVAMALFYNQLGITPEEAGFTNDELLRQSVILLGALVVYGLILVAVNWLTAVPFGRLRAVNRRLRLAQREKDRRLLVALTVAPFILTFLAMMMLLLTAHRTLALIADVLFLLAFPLVPRVVLRLPAAEQVAPLAEESVRRSRNLRPQHAFASAGIAVLIVLLTSLPLAAHVAAEDVKDGGKATGRLLPWRALPATIKWTTKSVPVKLTNNCRYLRFLGESNEKVYLFDTSSERSLRVPSDDIIVSVATRC